MNSKHYIGEECQFARLCHPNEFGQWVTRIEDPFDITDLVNIPYGLTPNGFILPPPIRSNNETKRLFARKHIEAIRKAPFDLDKVMAARLVARHMLVRTRRYNPEYRSYGLKHVVENFWKRNDLHDHPYISTGDCIWAMSLEGFGFRVMQNSQNCIFNVTSESVIQLQNNSYWEQLNKLSTEPII